MRRVVVTGATGFIGRHAISPLLERGFEVHVLARAPTSEPWAQSVEWHAADLMDPAATDVALRRAGATHLLHLAWYAEHGRFWTAPENLDWTAASLRLLRSFEGAGGERAVFAGTCAEYDWSSDCCTGAPLRPATLYGTSKDALRRIVEAHAAVSGLSAAWGRIFFAFGPGEGPTRVVATVARALARGETARCSAGTQIRDFLYVEDLADAFAALVDGDATGALDIGSGEGISLRELLERLRRLAGDAGAIEFGAPAANEPERIVADVGRLRDEVGWEPRHGLDEGLARTVAWWRTEGTADLR